MTDVGTSDDGIATRLVKQSADHTSLNTAMTGDEHQIDSHFAAVVERPKSAWKNGNGRRPNHTFSDIPPDGGVESIADASIASPQQNFMDDEPAVGGQTCLVRHRQDSVSCPAMADGPMLYRRQRRRSMVPHQQLHSVAAETVLAAEGTISRHPRRVSNLTMPQSKAFAVANEEDHLGDEPSTRAAGTGGRKFRRHTVHAVFDDLVATDRDSGNAAGGRWHTISNVRQEDTSTDGQEARHTADVDIRQARQRILIRLARKHEPETVETRGTEASSPTATTRRRLQPRKLHPLSDDTPTDVDDLNSYGRQRHYDVTDRLPLSTVHCRPNVVPDSYNDADCRSNEDLGAIPISRPQLGRKGRMLATRN
jgi:hypothetical protein